jgi:hypothetical protein
MEPWVDLESAAKRIEIKSSDVDQRISSCQGQPMISFRCCDHVLEYAPDDTLSWSTALSIRDCCDASPALAVVTRGSRAAR